MERAARCGGRAARGFATGRRRSSGPAWDEDVETPQPCPYLRRSFTVATPVTRARLYVTALGVYELELNGRRVGDHVLAPGWTSYHHQLRYDTFDVTDVRAAGRERDRCGARRRVVPRRARRQPPAQPLRRPTRPALPTRADPRRRLDHRRRDRRRLARVDRTDPRDRALRGRDLRRARRAHRLVGARLRRLGVDAGDHRRARSRDLDRAERTADTGHRTDHADRRSSRRRAAARSSTSARTWSASSSSPWSDRPGPRSRSATPRSCRTASSAPSRSGRAIATDRYTLRGDGPETWHPRFTFHGFRFAEITGWPGELAADDVTALVVHTDMTRTGWFECSDPRINRLHENVVWGMRGNFVGIPTDCPQRDERLGWTGDIGGVRAHRDVPLRLRRAPRVVAARTSPRSNATTAPCRG